MVDAGDNAEKAKNAAQRLVAQETDVVGATGAWLSSFTLAVTEVTERAELPVLTLSYSDVITGRGYKYVFQTSPTGGAQANGALPALLELAKTATGQPLKTVGIVMDNTAAPVSFVKPMREGGFQKLNLNARRSTRPSRRRSPTRPRWCRRCATPGPTSCSSCRRACPTTSSCWRS